MAKQPSISATDAKRVATAKVCGAIGGLGMDLEELLTKRAEKAEAAIQAKDAALIRLLDATNSSPWRIGYQDSEISEHKLARLQANAALTPSTCEAVAQDGWIDINIAPIGNDWIRVRNKAGSEFESRRHDGSWIDRDGKFRDPMEWLPAAPEPPTEAKG